MGNNAFRISDIPSDFFRAEATKFDRVELCKLKGRDALVHYSETFCMEEGGEWVPNGVIERKEVGNDKVFDMLVEAKSYGEDPDPALIAAYRKLLAPPPVEPPKPSAPTPEPHAVPAAKRTPSARDFKGGVTLGVRPFGQVGDKPGGGLDVTIDKPVIVSNYARFGVAGALTGAIATNGWGVGASAGPALTVSDADDRFRFVLSAPLSLSLDETDGAYNALLGARPTAEFDFTLTKTDAGLPVSLGVWGALPIVGDVSRTDPAAPTTFISGQAGLSLKWRLPESD